ncbi:MAG: hypothetical protein Q8N51_13425 [Gammaproteobacteria bacterium]|nr:hypothetical protein [Gammaproteobacteria bacterium]
MKNNTQPISKRSKRILEEANRHLCFAERKLGQLSIGEYMRLASYCDQIVTPFNLSERLNGVDRLSNVITAYVAERGQP